MSNQDSLREVLREHAFGAIALEECLTIMPTEHGAAVPSHWVVATDARIASVLPEETLRNELSRRNQEKN